MLGYIFSDRVQAITEVFGNLAWVIIGIVVAVILGWKIIQYLRSQDSVTKNDVPTRQQASHP
jgi:TRAP-type C4-dicarboxylate transport system permease small subunit